MKSGWEDEWPSVEADMEMAGSAPHALPRLPQTVYFFRVVVPAACAGATSGLPKR
nr:hypothetical protein RP007_03307 [Rhizobium sp. P007]